MKIIKMDYRQMRGSRLKYTLFSHDGHYIISAGMIGDPGEASYLLPPECDLKYVSEIYDLVCKSRVTPCALSDIVDDLICFEKK